MNLLPLPKSGTIQHIFHLADIHIRDGDSSRSRYTEYLSVINSLITSLKTHPSVQNQSALTVLVGDTLDHKAKLGGPGCTLFNTLIKGLSSCGPVYVIQGNHDFQQAFPNEPSILEGLLIDAPDNVFYMQQTGHYIAGSIGFGLVLTRDTLLLGSGAGQLEALPPFPDPQSFPETIQTKIALFHGTISGCLLQNYNPSQEGFPKDWIQGYNIHMLGDIHLHQIEGTDPLIEESKAAGQPIHTWHDKKDVWAYPGSLIQQNFGENAFANHGYLDWDLSKEVVNVCRVENKWAKLYIKCIEGDWLVGFPQKRWESLITAIEVGNFQHIELRIRNRIRPQDIEMLHQILRTYKNLTYEITNGLLNNFIYEESEISINDENQQDEAKSNILTCEQYNSPETWIQYVDQHKNPEILNKTQWQNWFRNPNDLLIKPSHVDPSNLKTATDRNKKIQKIINTLHTQLQHNSERTSLKIRYLEWNWLLCYGEDNWIDFDSLSNHIAGARARNHKGKSALFDIVCLALFGKPTPLRKGTDGVIHNQKPHGHKASVSIIIDIGQNTFRINREFYRLESGTTQNVKPIVSRLFNNGFETIAQGSTVNKWVAQSIGDIKDFLLSSMITQNQDQDFIFATHREQIDILDHSLNLNAYNTFISLLQETRNAYSSVGSKHRAIQSKVQTTMLQVDEEAVKQTQLEYQNSCSHLKLLEEELDSHQIPAEIDQKVLELPPQLIQNYIAAHKKNLITMVSNQTLLEWEKDPLRIYQEQNKTLITLKSQWEALQQFYDPNWKQEVLNGLLNSYSMTNHGSQEAPSRDHVWLNHESQAIAQWKNKWQVMISKSPQEDALQTIRTQINQTQQKYRLTYEEIAVLNTKYPDLEEQNTETFSEWQQKITDSGLKLSDQEFTALGEWCQTHPLTEPTLSPSQNATKEAELLKELQTIPWHNMNTEEIMTLIAQKQTEINTDKTIMVQLQTAINLQQAAERPNEPTEVTPPPLTLQAYQKLLTELQEAQQTLPAEKTKLTLFQELQKLKWNQLTPLNEELARLEQRLAEITAHNYPFNPECSACQQQPWKLELANLTQNIQAKKTHRETLSQAVNANQDKLAACLGLSAGVIQKLGQGPMQSMVQDLQKHISETESKIANGAIQQYQEMINSWAVYAEYLETQKTYRAAMESWISSKDAVIINQKQAETIQNKIQQGENTLKQLQNCIANQERWRRTQEECDQNRLAWVTYQTCQDQHQKYIQVEKTRQETKNWEIRQHLIDLNIQQKELSTLLENLTLEEKELTNYLDELKSIEERETTLTNDLEIWKTWCTLETSRRSGEAFELQKQTGFAENKAQYLHWIIVLQSKKTHESITSAKSKIQEERQKNNQLLKTVTTYEHSLELLHKQKEDANTLGNQILELETIHVALDHLIDIFSNFRQWLYQTKVIPKLLDTANNIANLIIGSDDNTPTCRLTCNIKFGGRKELILNWKILSHGNEPSIYYGGGFQKIIYGLALRIAIANIGASSIVCRQFFIDEGFSSADSEHLERVHVLLNNLLNLYDSIIMVTHLDTLKESITQDLVIERDSSDLVSRLHIGPDRTSSLNLFAHYAAEEAPSLKPIISGSSIASNTDDVTEIPVLGSGIDNIQALSKRLANPDGEGPTELTVLNPDKCQGLKKNGQQCSFNKKPDSQYCKKHGKTAESN